MDEAAKKRGRRLTLWIMLPINVAILYILFFSGVVPLLGAILIGAIVVGKFVYFYRLFS